MEKQDAFDVEPEEDLIDKAFDLHSDKAGCSKGQLVIQNNIANIQVHGEAGVCDDDYDAGF